jgi:hypothetical protein
LNLRPWDLKVPQKRRFRPPRKRRQPNPVFMITSMNRNGNPKTLVASQPGNFNAVKSGVHSPRLIQARAAEIEAELTGSFDFSPIQLVAAREVARCMAIIEAIDRDLDDRGLVDKRDKPRYLLDHRARISRQLERWLEKISTGIERQTAADVEAPRAESEDYVRELQRIALGNDAHARTRDRLVALRQLIALGVKGETAYLETPINDRLAYLVMKSE